MRIRVTNALGVLDWAAIPRIPIPEGRTPRPAASGQLRASDMEET